MRDNHESYPGTYLGDVGVARFSPDASSLVVIDYYRFTKYWEISETGLAVTCDDAFQSKYTMVMPSKISFLDNKYFIISIRELSHEHSLALETIPRNLDEETVTLPICDYPTSLFYNRETATLIVNYLNCNFEELKLHWP